MGHQKSSSKTVFYVDIQFNAGEEYVRASGPHTTVRDAQISALTALQVGKNEGFLPNDIHMTPVEE